MLYGVSALCAGLMFAILVLVAIYRDILKIKDAEIEARRLEASRSIERHNYANKLNGELIDLYRTALMRMTDNQMTDLSQGYLTHEDEQWFRDKVDARRHVLENHGISCNNLNLGE